MKMRKYIDADKAIKDYAHYGIKHFYDATDLEAILNECPAADVQEVRHGRYEQHDDPLYAKGGYWECSCCKWRISNLIFIEDINYCPKCGAKMDEVDE